MKDNLLTNNLTRCCKCGNTFKLTENQFLTLNATGNYFRCFCKDCIPESEKQLIEDTPENGGVLVPYEPECLNDEVCVVASDEEISRINDICSPEETDSQKKIRNILKNMTDLLIYKNQKYGDSALKPNNIFYKGDATNSILIRLDDKIGRIKNNSGAIRINDVCDTIGYLTLLLVSLGATDKDFEVLKD